MTITAMTKDRPILFSGEMVRAILSGRKTQTRRVIAPWPEWRQRDGTHRRLEQFSPGGQGAAKLQLLRACPYGQPGERLWVRETWAGDQDYGCAYRADHPTADLMTGELDDGEQQIRRWRPSIHMPRWASRLTLEIAAVRVERLQDISREDAKAEGVQPTTVHIIATGATFPDYIDGFHYLWDSINTKSGHRWSDNPWVWIVEFKRVEP